MNIAGSLDGGLILTATMPKNLTGNQVKGQTMILSASDSRDLAEKLAAMWIEWNFMPERV